MHVTPLITVILDLKKLL